MLTTDSSEIGDGESDTVEAYIGCFCNCIAHFHNYDWLCHLATFINNDGVKKVAK